MSAKTEKSVKKGRRAWGRDNLLHIANKREDRVYRWVENSPARLSQVQAVGWEFCNETTGEKVAHVRPERINDGAELTSAFTYHDMVLMSIDKESYEDRERYISEKTERQTVSEAQKVKAEISKMGVKAYGTIETKRHVI